MKFNISKKWLLKAANKEDKLPVSAGAFTFDMVAGEEGEERSSVVAKEPCAYLSVFGRLINMRRRERGLTLERLADMARIDLDEFVGIEQVLGYTPEPRTSLCTIFGAVATVSLLDRLPLSSTIALY